MRPCVAFARSRPARAARCSAVAAAAPSRACVAPADALRARVARREQRAGEYSEAGLAVLERAIALQEPLDPKELALTVRVGLAYQSESVIASILAH